MLGNADDAHTCGINNLALYDHRMIYLLRHGHAERDEGDDAARRLTAKGEHQARTAGAALIALDAVPETCLTSPKLRAADTARLTCEPLGLVPETAPELAGGRFDSLALAAGRGDVILVGHEPDLSAEVARLTGANVKLRKGGLVIVDGSTLLALLRPQDLAAIAGVTE
jgi:phosphohistidine phosphatase